MVLFKMFIPLLYSSSSHLGMNVSSIPILENSKPDEKLQIPSSINRIYSMVYPDSSNYGLNFAGSLVLPLQGFWNTILYITISTSACKELWRSHVTRRLQENWALEEAQNMPTKQFGQHQDFGHKGNIPKSVHNSHSSYL
jgi:hypothetical protein